MIEARTVWREQADTLQWQGRWRVISGYGWGAFLAIQSAFGMVSARNGMEVAGNLLCILGAVALAAWWRRFAVRADLPPDLPVRALLAAYKAEAVRQQRLARSVGVWSVLPLAGGLLIAGAGHLAARHALNPRSLSVMAALAGLVVALAWVFGHFRAEQLQFRIDEVDTALHHEN